MKAKISLLVIALTLLSGLSLLAAPVGASNDHPQVVYATPTALEDGRIFYRVQEGETCLRIELLTSVKVADLIKLNNLDQNCTIIPGTDLLIGIVTPEPSLTPNPDVTATPLLPTPTPVKGTGEVCVVLFADINGNATREETEAAILGGAVSITGVGGVFSNTGLTQTGLDADGNENMLCFSDMPEGEYTISLAVPDGYNPTTATTYPFKLIAGNRSIVDFGAQASAIQPPAENGASSQSGRSPVLAILGGVLVLGGIGLAIYIRLLRR
jgi:hypothetical protein